MRQQANSPFDLPSKTLYFALPIALNKDRKKECCKKFKKGKRCKSCPGRKKKD
ncbi:MAG: hypothetical protein WAT40_13595 [Saprospiraceae bacterium]|nr:hypothetical protein [Candidatus Brachybacter algidus]MBK8747672.1 hypothetical protein [Candidatus Brachybacter algidus]MBL0120863.1 hypothetical protein [Candidatus Brachybacter algidus]MBP7541583.1 hypothetical protein [Saprospiraceae bacterium]